MTTRPRLSNVKLLDSFSDFPDLGSNKNALRKQLLLQFIEKRSKQTIKQRRQHINSSEEIAEHIAFFFDDNGKPQKNTNIKEIADYRKKLETEINWIDALSKELKRELRTLQMIEKSAVNIESLHLSEDKEELLDYELKLEPAVKIIPSNITIGEIENLDINLSQAEENFSYKKTISASDEITNPAIEIIPASVDMGEIDYLDIEISIG